MKEYYEKKLAIAKQKLELIKLGALQIVNLYAKTVTSFEEATELSEKLSNAIEIEKECQSDIDSWKQLITEEEEKESK